MDRQSIVFERSREQYGYKGRERECLSRRLIDDIYADCSEIDLQMVASGDHSHFEVGPGVL